MIFLLPIVCPLPRLPCSSKPKLHNHGGRFPQYHLYSCNKTSLKLNSCIISCVLLRIQASIVPWKLWQILENVLALFKTEILDNLVKRTLQLLQKSILLNHFLLALPYNKVGNILMYGIERQCGPAAYFRDTLQGPQFTGICVFISMQLKNHFWHMSCIRNDSQDGNDYLSYLGGYKTL